MIVLRVLLSLFLFALGMVAAFAAGMWWYEQAPGRGRARVLRLAGIAVAAFGGFLLAVGLVAGLSPAELVTLCLTLLPMIVGVAAGLLGVHRTALRELDLRVEGDALAHWRRLLLEGDGWWLRSRAARELGQLDGRRAEAEQALALAGRSEVHQRVRDAIGNARALLRKAAAAERGGSMPAAAEEGAPLSESPSDAVPPAAGEA